MRRSACRLWERARLAAAAAAAGVLALWRQSDSVPSVDGLERLRDAWSGVQPPPGVFELHVPKHQENGVGKTLYPRVAALLHEASSLKEVRETLRAVREWAAMGVFRGYAAQK